LPVPSVLETLQIGVITFPGVFMPLFVPRVLVIFALSMPLAPSRLPSQQPPAGGRGATAGGGGRGNATAIQPGESCPPGTTEIRPRSCLAPASAPPSILDYRPKSTLVAPVHMVRTAKFPAIDFHGHPQGLLSTPKGLDSLGRAMDELNVRLMISADNMSGERLRTTLASVRASATLRDRVRILAGIDFRNVGPGWAAKAVAQLESDVAAGAVGVGEIPKSLGLSITKPDGSRLRIDDPELDAIWDACARLKLPVFIHTADPQEFFKPVDDSNERWLEISLFPERRYPADKYPSFETLTTERDNLFRKHRNTTFVTAHMGWHANDLGRLDKLLTELPNVYTEVGAVLYDIGRQPRVAHDFFIKFQNRVLFGKDSFQPEEYPYYWRVFETKDDYFDYYRGYHAFWKLYGIDLPDTVLKKVYFQNALNITSALPHDGWPK
jgi:predicted TIM-barrel fold metal-dependent hydrolase